jgi:hypothetical protein
MSAALKYEDVCEEPSVAREPKCVTSATALWNRLAKLQDREQLAVAVCLESSSWAARTARGHRSRSTQERIVILFRSGGRVRAFDPGSDAGPLREVTGPQDLTRYFDDSAGFSYVVVR